MQLRKKRKKERQALGDKVSLFSHLRQLEEDLAWFEVMGFLVSVAFHAKAPPKEVPKTIENQRVYDETTVDPGDEEVFTLSTWLLRKLCQVLFFYPHAINEWTFLLSQVAFDEATDEFSAYFNKITNPKVLITTSDRPRGVSSFRCTCLGVACFVLSICYFEMLHWLWC